MNEEKQLYIVGELKDAYGRWEFIGVYDSVELAEANCTTDFHFVGPVALNETAPENTDEWPLSYYLLLEQ